MAGGFGGVSWADVLGLVGVVVYVGAYFALQLGLVRGQGYLYASLNTAAACCMLLSLTQNFNLSSAVIQVVYIAISVFGMARFYLLTHSIRFTDEERGFLDAVAPNLTKWQARRLLDLGVWQTRPAGTVLAEEGRPVSHFHYLADGAADVAVDAGRVAELGSGSMIGEMSCLNGVPASATVTLTEPSRVFGIDVKALNAYLARNQPVRHELESRFAGHIGQKLMRANAALSARR